MLDVENCIFKGHSLKMQVYNIKNQHLKEVLRYQA